MNSKPTDNYYSLVLIIFFFTEHHEGHLSLLRSSLVNSRTQGLVYDDLGMSEYVIYNENAISDGVDMKTKQRADILECKLEKFVAFYFDVKFSAIFVSTIAINCFKVTNCKKS